MNAPRPPRSGRDTERVFHAALYIRLSREDGDGGESLSVANQRALLSAYAASDPLIADCSEYIDDGYSGTDFDRPAFARMLDALRRGEKNCVVVKDLSRFGRNYIAAGKYLEEEFPALGVRFIALGDGIDSYLRPESADSILVPFKNLLNDEYSRDISKKIRAALDTRRANGVFIGSKASYGYRRAADRPGALEPDPEAAAVVRRIFSDYLGGMSKSAIARRLNAERVPSPAAYAGRGRSLWSDSSVDRILRNRVYTGTLVQGRNGNISYRVQKTRRRPESAWFVTENAHEALIPQADFDRAQARMGVFTRADRSGRVHALAGLVRCAQCGRAMRRRRVVQPYKTYEYYVCPTYRQDKTACGKHTVRADRVESAVLEAVRAEIAAAVDFSRVSRRLGALRRAPQEKESTEKALSRVMELKRGIYTDWKNGELTRQEYLSFKEGYDAQEKALREKLDAHGAHDDYEDFARLRALAMPQTLDRALAAALIDRVEIGEDGAISIFFRFSRPPQGSDENSNK